MIHICTPFASDKNLGEAYNKSFKLIGNDDWLCLTDTDVVFLTPDCGTILQEYANRNPNSGILTCFTNRVSMASKPQLLKGVIDPDPNITNHVRYAINQKRHLYKTSQLTEPISGMLMLISKRTWNDHKFSDDSKCLGVDTWYSQRLLDFGKSILRMDGLYVFHIYRLLTGVNDKRHLL